MHRYRGFTLVELVIVIVLLAIVATISVRFVSLSTQGALDVSSRQQRSLAGVVISEQISREVREAFPLSVRSNGPCLEWLPIVALHYRWNLQGNAAFAKAEFGRYGFPWLPGLLSRRLAAPMAGKMAGYLPLVGVHPETIPGVESFTGELISRLDKVARELEQNPQGFVVGDPVPYEEKR